MQWLHREDVVEEGERVKEVVMKVTKESSVLNGSHPDNAGSLRQGEHPIHQPEVVAGEEVQKELVKLLKVWMEHLSDNLAFRKNF